MKIVNIVLSGKFSNGVNLKLIPDAVYNPKKFGGAVYYYDGCTFLLFLNGSFVCLGAKSKASAKASIKGLAKLLEVDILKCATRNMVMSHKVSNDVDMTKLYKRLKELKINVIYEEELFNGMVWKDRGGTVRLFHTGSFFVTGLRNVAVMSNVCKNVCRLCLECKKRVISGDIEN